MNDAEEAPDRRLQRVVSLLLGFWEMAPLVLFATWLAPKLTRGHL